ncbi:hypothetical protein TcCL_NonESM06728 [Trypanosoma cruzi]|nr:hypothetical protein TcCL_Unassigned03602 [Trypanosoma cruzi]RNC43562.1 hypothetical protein TcCL_NonESM06728 [Trypanosoma cruzi]
MVQILLDWQRLCGLLCAHVWEIVVHGDIFSGCEQAVLLLEWCEGSWTALVASSCQMCVRESGQHSCVPRWWGRSAFLVRYCAFSALATCVLSIVINCGFLSCRSLCLL